MLGLELAAVHGGGSDAWESPMRSDRRRGALLAPHPLDRETTRGGDSWEGSQMSPMVTPMPRPFAG